MKDAAISERLEAPGVRPALFKLVEKATDSFDVYRSSSRIGTARIEENGRWTARFDAAGSRWTAEAKSCTELLRLVGGFLLLREARELAARPAEEADPDLPAKGKLTADQRLSLELIRRTRASRVAELDALLAGLRNQIKRAHAG